MDFRFRLAARRRSVVFLLQEKFSLRIVKIIKILNKLIIIIINKKLNRYFSMEKENIRSHVLGGNEREGLVEGE